MKVYDKIEMGKYNDSEELQIVVFLNKNIELKKAKTLSTLVAASLDADIVDLFFKDKIAITHGDNHELLSPVVGDAAASSEQQASQK